MSKAVFVCLNGNRPAEMVATKAATLARQIVALQTTQIPTYITPQPVRLLQQGEIVAGVLNPVASVQVAPRALCLGHLTAGARWDVVGAGHPDGNYAIFRADDGAVEVLSDVAGTRTLWYYQDNDIFIAATSQRAIIALLGSFELNAAVVPWMLATGTLGPGDGWDRRVRRLPPDSILRLDRRTWQLAVQTTPVTFAPPTAGESTADYAAQLRQTLDSDFQALDFNFDHWRLLLSGGYDSRAILYLLPDRTGLRTLTWGMQAARTEKLTDAEIAVRLAAHFDVPNEYFALDRSDVPVATVFARFLQAGEGRIDHIAGYMDGFQVWQRLAAAQVQGVIRGDEGFGWVAVSTPLDVRYRVGLRLWEDLANAESLAHFDLPPQTMPAALARGTGESLATWRDRLYHGFRMPVALGALNDLKFPFVELSNPLLCRNTLYAVRTLPDALRTDKVLYARLVDSMGPRIPIARHAAVAESAHVLKSRAVVDYLRAELSTAGDNQVLPKAFIDYTLSRLAVQEPGQTKLRQRLREHAKQIVPGWFKDLAQNTVAKPQMDFNTLAFRTYIICRIYNMMNEVERP
ncbi:MAG: hypothetical protein WDZ49_06665 [Litorilinea sp.]